MDKGTFGKQQYYLDSQIILTASHYLNNTDVYSHGTISRLETVGFMGCSMLELYAVAVDFLKRNELGCLPKPAFWNNAPPLAQSQFNFPGHILYFRSS